MSQKVRVTFWNPPEEAFADNSLKTDMATVVAKKLGLKPQEIEIRIMDQLLCCYEEKPGITDHLRFTYTKQVPSIQVDWDDSKTSKVKLSKKQVEDVHELGAWMLERRYGVTSVTSYVIPIYIYNPLVAFWKVVKGWLSLIPVGFQTFRFR